MRRVRDEQCVAISHLETTRHRRHRHFVSRLASLVSLNGPTVTGERRVRGQGSLALPPNAIFGPLQSIVTLGNE